MRITVDPKTCILCSVCEALSPEIFTQHPGYIEVDEKAAFEDEPHLLLAIEACPMMSIERIKS